MSTAPNSNAVDKGDLTLSVMFPSEYLKCEDLKGRNVTVKIANVKVDAVPMTGGRKERKCIVSLEKTKKKLIVGKTNGYALGVLISSNARDWSGKRITLCPDVDRLGRKEVATIRIMGSPDASGDRATAYSQAWRGERKGGALVQRLKQALGILEMGGSAPPVEPEDNAASNSEAGDAAVDDVEDIFAEEEARPTTLSIAPVLATTTTPAVDAEATFLARISAAEFTKECFDVEREAKAAAGKTISAEGCTRICVAGEARRKVIESGAT